MLTSTVYLCYLL